MKRAIGSQSAKVIGVIPARWGSTRLPGKSLLPLCGKPLIQWVIERARQARRLDELLVATDDERILRAATASGARAVLTAAHHPSGTDRIAEAIAHRRADVVINIQGDEPLIEPRLIDRLAQIMTREPHWDMATVAAPLTAADEIESRSVVKVVTDRRGAALYFSRAVIPFLRDADRAPADLRRLRHIGLYAYRRACLQRMVAARPCMLERSEGLEQLRALYLGARIKVVVAAECRSLGVDVPADIPRAEAALRSAGLAE